MEGPARHKDNQNKKRKTPTLPTLLTFYVISVIISHRHSHPAPKRPPHNRPKTGVQQPARVSDNPVPRFVCTMCVCVCREKKLFNAQKRGQTGVPLCCHSIHVTPCESCFCTPPPSLAPPTHPFCGCRVVLGVFILFFYCYVFYLHPSITHPPVPIH